MYTNLCDFVLRLYRGTRDCEAARFRGWALDLTASIIPYDSAIWAIGVAGASIHSAHLHRFPAEVFSRWETRRKADTAINDLVEAPEGRTLNKTLHAPSTHDGTPLDEGANHGIRHALCTTARDAATRLHHFICLYRSSVDKAFSEEERAMQEFLAPHLIEARHNNLVVHFNRHKQGPYLSGICDRFGLLHQAEAGFEELLRSEWPHTSLPYLPAEFGSAAATGRQAIIEGTHTVFKLAPLGDLTHIEARKKSRLAQLSARERLITKHLVTGQTYKQIAITLNISPSTVTKHVNSIYKKTDARNKTQLAKIVEETRLRS
jgi:DNA-binding CsgD family transcriptional regulator